MLAVNELIRRKRDGQAISGPEMEELIGAYANGEVPDYQMAAWLMAVYFQGLSRGETVAMTRAMLNSGATVDMADVPGIKVDKHSSGGVGDKTSLVLLPLVAAAGVPVVKMAGRGLGHTGGTIDKLESVPGLRTELTPQEVVTVAERVGLCIAAQSKQLVPADGRLYALRDVTATVESVPLIAASIMSKKIAAGADRILLDVKTGKGAFAQDMDTARQLAELMVSIGAELGRTTAALVTGMDQPLGLAVGNALEMHEAVMTLRGAGPADVRELCLALGALMLAMGGQETDLAKGRAKLKELLSSGQALTVLRKMVAAQGGDTGFIEAPERLLSAPVRLPLVAAETGYVSEVHARIVGDCAVRLGAGRMQKGTKVDHRVGILLHKKVGAPVMRGELLAEVHAAQPDRGQEALLLLKDAFVITAQPPQPAALVRGFVTPDGFSRQLPKEFKV